MIYAIPPQLLENGEAEGDISIADLIQIAWRYRILLIVIPFICAAIAAAWAWSKPDIYQHSVTMDSGTAPSASAWKGSNVFCYLTQAKNSPRSGRK
jgi:LPS O-antigen subunit length determinant protein (WzzB/FepE family)